MTRVFKYWVWTPELERVVEAANPRDAIEEFLSDCSEFGLDAVYVKIRRDDERTVVSYYCEPRLEWDIHRERE